MLSWIELKLVCVRARAPRTYTSSAADPAPGGSHSASQLVLRSVERRLFSLADTLEIDHTLSEGDMVDLESVVEKYRRVSSKFRARRAAPPARSWTGPSRGPAGGTYSGTDCATAAPRKT